MSHVKMFAIGLTFATAVMALAVLNTAIWVKLTDSYAAAFVGSMVTTLVVPGFIVAWFLDRQAKP